MKIRSNYVSNSSSTSFIVTEDLTSKGIACLKLSKAQMELLNGNLDAEYGGKVFFDTNKDFWLTEFVSDCDDKKWDIVTSVEHRSYESGQMCGEPYTDDEVYNEYQIDGDRSVYLRKEHDLAKQMSFNKFAKEFKRAYFNSDVIVQYKQNGEILLKVVR